MAPLAPRPPISSRKRKQAPSSSGQSFRSKKRVRLEDARIIATQTTDAAFKDGEIDVEKFVRARDFEIRALTARGFQCVPKYLRSRTASHDVKRVPKRLRARAKKEVRRRSSIMQVR